MNALIGGARFSRRPMLGAALIFVALASISWADADDQLVSREYAIKAGVINVLAKCVAWPLHAAPSSSQPLKIGVLGKDPFLENGINQLDRLISDSKLNGINIVVVRFDTIDDYEPCHILFVSNLASDHNVGKSAADRLAEVNAATDGKSVLVIGESAGLANQGATANLLFDRATNLIRLEINPDAAARAGLKLAPDLLRLRLVQIVRDSQH